MASTRERVANWLGTRTAAPDARAAVSEVLWVLQRELEDFNRTVWLPTLGDDNFRAMRARRERLLEDIEIVDAILARYEGRAVHGKPLPPQPNRAPAASHGYGET